MRIERFSIRTPINKQASRLSIDERFQAFDIFEGFRFSLVINVRPLFPKPCTQLGMLFKKSIQRLLRLTFLNLSLQPFNGFLFRSK